MCQTGASTFHCHWEYMEIRTTQLGFYLDKELFIVQGLWHSLDRVPLWSTISGFPYYNLNHPPPLHPPPKREGFLYPLRWVALGNS
jgi:hypothetical protein